MGLFKRKEVKKEMISELPELPKLPRLPELPETESDQNIPSFPRYSPNYLGDKFSQNKLKDEQKTGNFLTNSPISRIREAITGEKEEVLEANEFVREQMMPEHRDIMPRAKINLEFPSKMEGPARDLELRSWQSPKSKKSGEVFIKIDKFEESLKIFESTKDKLADMEKLLANIKELKEKEDKELSHWISEIQMIKSQTEKVERDLFSKLE